MRAIILLLLFFPLRGAFAQIHRVAALGSSTTYGLSADPLDSAWVSRLQRHLARQYSGATVHNLAVPGKDCYHAMPDGFSPPEGRPSPISGKNITEALRALKSLDDPSHGLIIVSYASNNYQLYSAEEILFCLQTIYNEAVSAGHRCLISTTQPRHDKHFESSAAKRKLSVLKDSILNRFGASAINFYDGFANPADSSITAIYSAGDKIHYNNAGHRELFRRVSEKISLITSVIDQDVRSPFYPNPVKDRLLISRDALPANTLIQLYDPRGTVVWSGIAKDDCIELEGLSSGLYLIRWIEQERAMTRRILKH